MSSITWKLSSCCMAVYIALCNQFAFAQSQVPEGFEELVTGQDTWLEVKLLGQPSGLFEATVTFDSVRFKDPQALIKALNFQQKPGSPLYQQALQLLSSPLARHGNLACSSNANAPGCGYLTTDTLAIIYDENNNVVDVFTNKALLPEADKNALYHTPTRQTENAFVHQQLINVSSLEDSQSLSVQGSGALGIFSDSYMGLDWSLNAWKGESSNSQTVNINDLYYRQGLGIRHYMQIGRMDARDLSSNLGGNMNFSLLPLEAIDGVRIGSTLSYLNVQEASKGSPLLVLLAAKSRVDAFRGNQLLGTFYLNSGSNTLDTSNFPSGSYAVTLNIYENNQLTRSEVQPFTKTGQLEDGHVQWFLQFGETADNTVAFSTNHENEASRDSVVQAGIKAPLFTELSTTIGAASTAGENYAEAGLQWNHGFHGAIIDGVLSTDTRYFTGTEGSRGDKQQISYNDGFSLSVFRDNAQGKSCSKGNAEANTYADIGCYTSFSATLAVPIKSWSTSLGYTYNKNDSFYSSTTNYDARQPFEENLVNNTRSQTTSKTWQLSVNKTFSINDILLTTRFGGYRRESDNHRDNDNGVYIGFSLTHNSVKSAQMRSSNTSFSSDYRHSQSGSEVSYNASQNWNWGSQNDRELGIDIGGANTDSTNASLHGRLNGRYGESNLTVSDYYDREQSNHQMSISGSYNSSLALSRSGMFWGPGGNGVPGGAVAVNVKSRANDSEELADNDAEVDVAVDGGGYATLSPNSGALFPVAAFTQSRVTVNESRELSKGSQASISSGAGSQQLFLLPGKMKLREVTVESQYTFVGQLVTQDGKPLTPQAMLNASIFSGADDGGFSAELNHLAKNLYVQKGNTLYRCPVTVQATRDVVRYVGKTVCTVESWPLLPAEIQEVAAARKLAATMLTEGK